MRLFIFLNLIFLSLFATGCGGGSSSKSDRTVRIPQDEVSDIMSNQSFECASINGESCPSGIARLFILNPEDFNTSAVCSGFMVAPTLMVTNHHCVATQAKCENTFVAVYQGSTYLSTRCKRLIRSAEDFPDVRDRRRAVDYAVVELEHSYEGEVLKVTDEHPQEKEDVRVWVIDHIGLDRISSKNLYESRITELKCKIGSREQHASLFLSNCPIVRGNSGSPVLDANQNVVGVVWGGSALYSSAVDLQERREMEDISVATESSYFLDLIN